MYAFLQPFLNRGGAGRSMTRQESIDALTPLVVEHQKLLLAYDAALARLQDRDLAARLNDGMNRARTELAKLKETILSLGGTPPTAVDLDTTVNLGDTDADVIHALDARERAFRKAAEDTLGLPHHQMRSTAILENAITGSKARLDTLHPLVTRMPRPGSRPASRATAVPSDETATPADLAPDERHAHEQPAIDAPDPRA